jgi:protein associated with RNAse G/E
MKRLLLFFCGLLFIGNIAFSQNGYQNFRWGMTTTEVQNLLPINTRNQFREMSHGPDMMHYMMFHLYANEIANTFGGRIETLFFGSQIINREVVYRHRYNRYTDEGWGWDNEESLLFYFENNRFFGVQTLFRDENLLNELQSRYGRSTQYSMTGIDGDFNVRVWEQNNRFIMWCGEIRSNRQYVGFFDSATVRRICQNGIEENRRLLREEQQRTRTRLE